MGLRGFVWVENCISGCFRKQVLVAATQPVLVLEFELDF